MGSVYPKMTSQVVEAARSLITPKERERRPCFETLTKDAIRRWAFAIGDANPLWLDEDYAARTMWGSILAPPTFCETAVRGTAFDPLRAKRVAPGEPPALSANRRPAPPLTGFPGLQTGRQFSFYRPVRVGTQVRGTRHTIAAVDSQGRVAGDCIEPDADVDTALEAVREECADPNARILMHTDEIKIYDKVTGELLVRDIAHLGRFARGIPMEISRYRDHELPCYSNEEIGEIISAHESEYLRGADPLYWEDVSIGDELPTLPKGPHTPHDFTMYHAAFGGYFDLTDRLKYTMLNRYDGIAIVDPETNVPEFADAMHHDGYVSRSLGYPRGFDGSMQRISWFGHLVTNWMGDNAFLRQLNIFQYRPLFLYDTMWLRGRVTGKNSAGSEVEIDLTGINQRGERISHGSAWVVLEKRSGDSALACFADR